MNSREAVFLRLEKHYFYIFLSSWRGYNINFWHIIKCLWKSFTWQSVLIFILNIVWSLKQNPSSIITRQRNRSTQIHVSVFCSYTQWVYTHRNTGTHLGCCFHSLPTCDWLQQSGVREAALYSLKSAVSWHLLLLFPFTRRQKYLLSVSYADSQQPKHFVVYSHDESWITSTSLTEL